MINLVEIQKGDFDTIKSPLLFKEEKANNCFAIISGNNNEFKLAWNSNTMKPIMKRMQANIYGIGIDQHFAIINLSEGCVELVLDLDYNFFDFEIYNNKVLVITELEIVALELTNYQSKQEYALPDIFENIEMANGMIKVWCLNCEEPVILLIE